MNREIKFRQPLFIKGRFNRWHYWGFIEGGSFAGPYDLQQPSYQYTGLKDNSDTPKEIYEEDILKYNFPKYPTGNEVVELIGVVKFLNFSDSPMGNLAGFYIVPNRDPEERHLIHSVRIVIGNTYENPELMK